MRDRLVLVSANVTFEALRASRHDTPEAIAIMHPDQPLKVIHLPRSQVFQCAKITGSNRHQIEVSGFVAQEHDIYD